MTTTVFIMTFALFVIGASCSPVVAATSSLSRPQLPSAVYPPSLAWPGRRYVSLESGQPLADPYVADYSTEDAAAIKRSGNGAWIWMPAQGYVSVSKNQQASAGDAGGKHGRIMRYGK